MHAFKRLHDNDVVIRLDTAGLKSRGVSNIFAFQHGVMDLHSDTGQR